MSWLNLIKPFFPWIVVFVVGFVGYLRIESLSQQLDDMRVKKERAEANVVIAAQFNDSLNNTIGGLTNQLADFKTALVQRDLVNGTAVANLEKAVKDIGILDDSDRTKKLTGCNGDYSSGVSSRMQQLYRSQGIDENRHVVSVPTSG